MTHDQQSLILQPQAVPVGGGYNETDSWIWCGSCVQGRDGLYHLFASRWTKKTPFACNWFTNASIVRAVAERPEGPYHFVEDVLPQRGGDFWDGGTTRNPTVHQHAGKYYMFYVGTRYDGPAPTRHVTWDDPYAPKPAPIYVLVWPSPMTPSGHGRALTTRSSNQPPGRGTA